jgi:glycosyltransferase involved in cell wall biosynthesis
MNHAATDLDHARSGERKALGEREPSVEIVVPVYNEERDLEPGVRRLYAYLESFFPFPALVTIADNASTDATPTIGARLAAELPAVRYLRLEERGRGRALAAAWSESDADVVAYMDVDLSTGLEALLPLVAPLISGHSDLAIGSRLAGCGSSVSGGANWRAGGPRWVAVWR